MGAVPSCSAVASDTVRQRPVAAGAVVEPVAAAACRIDTVVPARASCHSLVASVLECAACRLAVPLVRVRYLQATRRPSHRPLHSHCQ